MPGRITWSEMPLGLQTGEIVAGRFVVRGELGSGGMASVYRVEDQQSGKDVALKVMFPSRLRDARLRERFLREANIG